jgi:CubicO group peptidase (beta-lactamase class C family)
MHTHRLRLFSALLLTLALLPAGALAQLGDVPGSQLVAPVSNVGTTSLPAPVPASEQTEPDWRGFDEWVESVMAEWKIPGLAVAAVKDGQMVLSKGYGYRDVERRLPVTENTLMAIGSNSKSFTAVILGQLVDEGRLDWDAPVRDYLPDFQLYDEVATRLMTPRDLLNHRSGLPRHDRLWIGRSYTRQELYDRMRHLEPSATFRQRYQYQNLMFMTAGILAERITGRSWEELVKERILDPLGMTRTNFSADDMPGSGDHSLPYMERQGSVVAVPMLNIDAVGPAGSINSSIDEMMRYIQMMIDQGSWQGRTLLSRTSSHELQSPQSASPVGSAEDPNYPELGPGGYGLALGISSYRGQKLVAHGGGIDGFISSMSWMPDANAGVMVLTNFSGNNPVPTMVMRQVYDRLLGLEPVDWRARTRTQQAEAQRQQEERRRTRESERVAGTSPSHPLRELAGSYQNPAHGTVTIRVEGEGLVLTLDRYVVPLTHIHYNVFEGGISADGGARWHGMRVSFRYGGDGRIGELAIPLEPSVSDFIFQRAPSSARDR